MPFIDEVSQVILLLVEQYACASVSQAFALMIEVTDIAVYLLASLHIVMARQAVYHTVLCIPASPATVGRMMSCRFVTHDAPVA